MRTLLSLLICLGSFAADAQEVTYSRRGVAPVASGPSYIIEERFETPANSNSWTKAGTQTWFYDTAPAPLAGTNSVMLSSIGSEAYTNFTGRSEFYFHYKLHITQPLQSQYHIWFGSNSTMMSRLRINTSGQMQLIHNTVSATSNSGLFNSNTTYHIFGYFLKGTIGGTDSTGWIKYSTDGTKPSTNAVSLSNGTASNQVNRLAIQGWSPGEWILDDVLLDDEDIGSNP